MANRGKIASESTLKKMSENNCCENHPGAKLTREKALEIRRLRHYHFISQQKLAKRFRVSRGCIVHLLSGETWNPNNLSRKELLQEM